MSNIVILKPNPLTTRGAETMGFKENKVGRFPNTSASFSVYMFPDGRYNHGVPLGKHKDKIEKEVLSSNGMDSDYAKSFFRDKIISFGASDEILNLDDAQQLLNYYCIKAQNDFAVDSSENKAASENDVFPPQYIIVKSGSDEAEEYDNLKKTAKASVQLQEISEKKKDYMIGIAKYLAPASKDVTTYEKAYVFLSGVLDGKMDDSSKLKGCNRFLNVLTEKVEVIMVSADIKEAMFRNIIYRDNGKYINGKTGNVLGITTEQVINFFTKDQNQEELGLGKASDHDYSIRRQLELKRSPKSN